MKADDSPDEDSVLVGQILSRSGDSEACRRLVAKYWRLLIAWVRPRIESGLDAEDIVQETFIRAFRGIGALKNPSRFAGWLLKIARNRTVDYKRKRREFQSLDKLSEEGDGPLQLTAPPVDLGEKIDRGEEYDAILEAVDNLPEKYRIVVMLRYFEGLSGSEIALILDEPAGTVRNRLFRAHEKIRGLLRSRAERKQDLDLKTKG